MQHNEQIKDVPLEITNEVAIKTPPTKQHEGVTLTWSPMHNAYQFPLPNPGKVALILDEQTGKFVPAFADRASLIYEEKTAEKDGISFTQKRVYQPDGISYNLSDVEAARLRRNVAALEFQVGLIETLSGAKPLIQLAVIAIIVSGGVAIAFGFWNMAYLIGQEAALAVAEISYYAVWILGSIIAIFGIRFLWPILWRKQPETYEFEAATPMQSAQEPQSINININQAANSGAQWLVNNRNL